MGLTISWNATAVNGPMFAEVVPAKHRTMIYAFDQAFEGSFSAFAAPIVGILAEKIYGYNPKSVDPKNRVYTRCHRVVKRSFFNDGSSIWFVLFVLHSFVPVLQEGPGEC